MKKKNTEKLLIPSYLSKKRYNKKNCKAIKRLNKKYLKHKNRKYKYFNLGNGQYISIKESYSNKLYTPKIALSLAFNNDFNNSLTSALNERNKLMNKLISLNNGTRKEANSNMP